VGVGQPRDEVVGDAVWGLSGVPGCVQKDLWCGAAAGLGRFLVRADSEFSVRRFGIEALGELQLCSTTVISLDEHVPATAPKNENPGTHGLLAAAVGTCYWAPLKQCPVFLLVVLVSLP